jgi:hypothetical protein
MSVLTAPVESPSGDKQRGAWRFALLAFAVVAVVLGIVVPLSNAPLSPGEGHRGEVTQLDSVLGPWIQFDAGWYRRISEDGYTDADVASYDAGQESAAAFFPGYPAAVRAATPLAGGDPFLAEIAVTMLAGALVAILFLRWCQRRESVDSSRMAVLALLLFPYAFYLIAAPYGDALFLLATIAAFLFAEDDRPVLAGLAGAVATLTRPVGIAVVIGLVVVVLEKRGALQWRPRFRLARSRVRRGDPAVLLSCLGAGAFMVYEWFRFGSPVAYSIAQRGWDQAFGVRTALKFRFFDHVLHDPRPGFVLRLAAQAVLVLVFVAAVPAVWRRFGAGYGLYTAIALALPTIGSATFISTGRYVLAAFPVFALLGEWLARQPRVRTGAVLATSCLALVFMASLFGRSFLVA